LSTISIKIDAYLVGVEMGYHTLEQQPPNMRLSIAATVRIGATSINALMDA
jgi:hypothetical protein